jgi:hypothetical protein
MNFLKYMHELHDKINWVITLHPWKTALAIAVIVGLFLYNIHFAAIIMILWMAFTVFMIGCDAVYIIKSGYKPECCDKCGQSLPEKRPHGF